MPWRELSIMEQREEFVRLALTPGANRSELCRRFGISREAGYKWLRRYRAEGAGGLADRSRRPHSSPLRTPQAMEAQVLHNAWGGRKIAKVLRNTMVEVPAASTITEILRRHGKLEERQHEHPGPYQRFERDQPNELWQMDFKGHFAIGRGRCHPLTVLEQEKTVRQRLVLIFRRYGMPLAMLMDNAPPWGDPGGEPYTALTVWLLRLGIRVIHGQPYHPQTQGKDERFHRSLKAEVLQGKSFADLAQCQHAFDRWRPVYNHQRPHEALGLAVPADRYRMSPRCFCEELPPIEYATGDIVRKVDVNGRISFKNREWRIGKAFCSEHIALRPTAEDGLYTVHYGVRQVGTIDLDCHRSRSNAQRDGLSPSCPQAKQQQMFNSCD
jgi:transposase InsO family protein